MRRYETIVIVHPSISQEERQAFFDKVTALISSHNGLLIRFEDWGQRRLAYEIRKETRGYYGFLEFCGDGDLVKEMERNIRLDDRGLKYMTICTAQEVDEEAVKAEIEATQAKAEEAAQAKAEEAVQAEAEEAAQAEAEGAAQAAEGEEASAPASQAATEEAPPEGASTPSAVPESTESSEKEATPDDTI